MTKRWIFAAGCGIFTSLVFVCAAQAQSAQEFVNKVAISDMFEIQSSRARPHEAAGQRHQAVRGKNGQRSPEDIQ
jgi:hypothetical protein